jgi:hypothetical protein
MTNIKSKVIAGLSAASLFAASALPAFAATTVTVRGNGAFSTNTVNVVKVKTKIVTQTNTAVFTNIVSTTSTSGGNSASFNTGGATTVISGDASSTVTIVNVANSNVSN